MSSPIQDSTKQKPLALQQKGEAPATDVHMGQVEESGVTSNQCQVGQGPNCPIALCRELWG